MLLGIMSPRTGGGVRLMGEFVADFRSVRPMLFSNSNIGPIPQHGGRVSQVLPWSVLDQEGRMRRRLTLIMRARGP